MKRMLSLLLTLAMLCSLCTVFAQEETPAEETPAEEITVAAPEETSAEEPAAEPVEETAAAEPEETPAEEPAEEPAADEAEAIPAADAAAEEFTGSGEGPSGSGTTTPLYDTDELAAGYLNEALGDDLFPVSEAPVADGGSCAGNQLTGENLNVYNQLKTAIAEIAAGTRTSTAIEVTLSCVNTTTRYTAADLGVSGTAVVKDSSSSSGYSANSKAVEALYAKLDELDLGLVMNALNYDCPYDLYWYGNQYSYSKPGYSWYVASISNLSTSVLYFNSNTITVTLSVDAAYSGSSASSVKTNTTAVTTVVNTAKSVVSAASSLSDYNKLVYYRNWICSAVSYNDNAAAGNASNLQPWNIIYVFDGNSSTNVVCEGYARAFQYLCDLTTWTSGNVYCLYVSGTMDGAAHAWNVVHMGNDKNYFVDVTNCDSGTIGYPDKLFLCGGSGSVTGGYTFQSTKYIYDLNSDDNMQKSYTTAMLTLAGSNYDPTTMEVIPKLVITYSGTGWTQDSNGRWYYFKNSVMVKSSWVKSGSSWYYLGADGAMVTGMQTISGAKYYFNAKGVMQTGWISYGGNWYYAPSSGALATSWKKVSSVWYYFGSDGKMYNAQWNGNYYLKKGGAMATGWQQIDGYWYYFNTSGIKQVNWLRSGSTWYYMGTDGKMYNAQWNGNYYLKSGGAMAVGWYKIDGSWYYFSSSGTKYAASSNLAYDGWQKVGSKWYYFGTDGVMFASRTATIAGITYTFDKNGGYTTVS